MLPQIDARARRYMCEEIALDEERGALYQDPRLKPGAYGTYVHLLKEAAAWGSPASLAEAIRAFHLLMGRETRVRAGRASSARVPRQAAEVLAETELHRYYVRAMCRCALEDGLLLEVYRARAVRTPRPGSEARIGSRVDPRELLEDLRENSDRLTSALGIPAGPKSGLSVRTV